MFLTAYIIIVLKALAGKATESEAEAASVAIAEAEVYRAEV